MAKKTVRKSSRRKTTAAKSTGRKPKRASRSLTEYQAKRDFSKSPEPSGVTKSQSRQSKASEAANVTRKPGERFFCVQKHDASRLHYDFRLEHHGVLLSWAVPKGPSLNPRDKRLAMQVEDHPLDYGDFEGIIPSGYGAGTVLLWDRGSWTPENGDVDAALDKGELKFSLDGTKLKGSWVLVRTSGKFGRREAGDKKSWLLIKHRDDWAGEVDVTKAAPMSVKSFKNLEDIKRERQPDLWESHRE